MTALGAAGEGGFSEGSVMAREHWWKKSKAVRREMALVGLDAGRWAAFHLPLIALVSLLLAFSIAAHMLPR